MDIIEKQVNDLLTDVVKDLGYDIVRVKYYQSKVNTLQIMIEKLGGNAVNVKDCARVSNVVSTVLDVEDLIKDHYNLEISSPGLDRPLVKLSDFIKFKGSKVKILLKTTTEGVKRCKGKIVDVEGEVIKLKLFDNEELCVDRHNIDSANLIISDNLFKGN